jgi:glyoxylase-like metal-dependent hydrolase (beta-lactamase superfamily II)
MMVIHEERNMSESGRWIWEPQDVVTKVDDSIWLIDLGFQGRRGVVAAYVLAGNNEVALVETGPSSTLPALLDGIKGAGFSPEQLTHILVTHIHLDHSGAAGRLLREAPRAQVFVHPIGAPHLVDPSKLVASATRIYGDNMDPLWGEVAPIPEERVTALNDDEVLNVAGRGLRVLFTPGHASHHVAYVDESSGAAFTGDVGGIRMPGTSYVCAPTPPPELDLDAWRASVQRLKSVSPRRLFLTHFGAVDDAGDHLERLVPELETFVEIAEETLSRGADPSTLTAKLHARMEHELGDVPPDAVINLEWATPSYMATLGLTRYLTKAGRL